VARRDEDDQPTEPLPVIMPRGTEVPRPTVQDARPRGPFEAARPLQPSAAGPGPAATAQRTGPGQDATPPAGQQGLSPSGMHLPPPPDEPLRNEPPPVNPRLESLKDLYFTAAAIGEEALDKNFEVVSRRQRELIKEYFDSSQQPEEQAE
jgi:hypothetical protein